MKATILSLNLLGEYLKYHLKNISIHLIHIKRIFYTLDKKTMFTLGTFFYFDAKGIINAYKEKYFTKRYTVAFYLLGFLDSLFIVWSYKIKCIALLCSYESKTSF